MKYNIQQLYDPNLPQRLNDFLNYLRTIKGKSENTIESYKLDLIMFFRFLKLIIFFINLCFCKNLRQIWREKS